MNFGLDSVTVAVENSPAPFFLTVLPMRLPGFAAAALFAPLLWVSAPARTDIAAAVKALGAGDFALAEKELRADADSGNTQAQVMLGRVQRDARNPARNAAEAYAWFVRAAEARNAEGLYWAGMMTHSGEGTTRDPGKAAAWWREAAEAGYVPAMGMLASLHSTGPGPEKDMAEAVRWARQGAAKSDMRSQSILGRAYLLGQGGLVRDIGQALRWTRLAAMQGEPSAQAAMGRFYLDGVGVPQNYVQAHVWFNLAAARGQSQATKQRDELAAKMTAEQLAEAQKLATAWRPVRTFSTARGTPNGGSGTRVRTGSGSGFVVDARGSILTNHHVVRGCQEVRIPAHGVHARMSAFDERNDLALLQSTVTAEELPTFRSDGHVRLGESIVVAGFPLGELLSGGLNVTTGSVSALAGPRNNTAMMQITAPIQAGNSGGPVLDQGGHVIGVVVSKLNALRIAAVTGDVPQNVNFAINGSIAREFLETNGVQLENAATPSAVSGTVDVAERAKRYTLLIECWR